MHSGVVKSCTQLCPPFALCAGYPAAAAILQSTLSTTPPNARTVFGLHCSGDPAPPDASMEQLIVDSPASGSRVSEPEMIESTDSPVTFMHAHKTHSTVLVYSSRGGLSTEDTRVAISRLLSCPGVLGVLRSPSDDMSHGSPTYNGERVHQHAKCASPCAQCLAAAFTQAQRLVQLTVPRVRGVRNDHTGIDCNYD